MGRPLSVLIVDDSESDAVLIINELTKNGFDVVSARVDLEETFRKEIASKNWDIIICDYIMPDFSLLGALAILNAEKISSPLIVLTGMLENEVAPELIKAGASDFVTKNELPKLVAVIEREIARAAREVNEKNYREEREMVRVSSLKDEKPRITIRHRFIQIFAVLTGLLILYSCITAVKGIRDSGVMVFQKASVVADSIINGIEKSRYYSGISGMNTDSMRQYLKDTGIALGYDISFFSRNGEIAAAAGDMTKKAGVGAIHDAVQKTLLDGITRNVSVSSGHIIPKKLLIARLKNGEKKTPGVLALDYSKDYILFIKNTYFYAATALLAMLSLLGVIIVSWNFMAGAVLTPVERVQKAMESIVAGDLSWKIETKNNDEIGGMESSFDKMRENLKEIIMKLKSEIRDRYVAEQALQDMHLKLTGWVMELDKKTHEITMLNQMSKTLQSCKSEAEFHAYTKRYVEQLFPADYGAVYLVNETGKFMETASMWGKEYVENGFASEDCRSFRDGHMHSVETPENSDMLCRHVIAAGENKNSIHSMCVPMILQGDTIGIFHIRSGHNDKDHTNITAKRKFAKEQLVAAVAENITLTLSNLKLQKTLMQHSTHDSLTGLFNRRDMKDTIEREIYRAKRNNTPFSVIMLDIDNFKKFNDDFGHEVGDLVLEEIGRFVKMTVRPKDMAYRYGGEEFLIIMPETNQEGANQCAVRLLEGTKALKINNKGIIMEGITISLGVAAYPNNGETVDRIIKAADTAMLDAKKAGRNRIILSNEAAM